MKNSQLDSKKRWIGLAQVIPYEGNDELEDAAGAFVSVVGDAEDEHAFLALVDAEMNAAGFDVISFEDVEPLANRVQYSLSRFLRDAIKDISRESPLAFGEFHTYQEADED